MQGLGFAQKQVNVLSAHASHGFNMSMHPVWLRFKTKESVPADSLVFTPFRLGAGAPEIVRLFLRNP
jgi:hypothetical protein